MSTTKTARKRNTKTTAPAAAVDLSRAELVYVDPAKLIIGKNARTTVDLDPAFLDSLTAFGVQEPITAWTVDGETYEVVKGQRRTLGALKIGLPEVPVLVRRAPTDEAMRIQLQIIENERRAAFTTEDKAAAYVQLTAFGVAAGDIEKAGVARAADVVAAVKVAASTSAQRNADLYGLTLEQAAVVAEFEDDDEAVTKLTDAATTGQFEHVTQTLRDAAERANAEAAFRQSLADQLTAAGVRIIDEPRTWIQNNTGRVEDLYDRDGNKADPDQHTQCPGHAAYITSTHYGDADPYRIGYACADLAANGHYPSKPTKLRPSDMTYAEREQVKAARKDVITSNQAWESAEKVRRAWLKKLFAGKTAPKGAVKFIAESLARADHELSQAISGNNELALTLLAVKTTGNMAGCKALAAQMARATDARAQLITLALILSAYEARTGKHSYRNVDNATSRYLLFLQSIGYALSDVETRATVTANPAEPAQAAPAPPEQDDDRDTEAPTKATAAPQEPDHRAQDDEDRDDEDPEDDGDHLENAYAAELDADTDDADRYAAELE
ncbi:ParB/RepB/Spo0J family partition protein [Hamadaea tsunoensis]|uniref:ParB/RepB/Spo0J family partition protein n=1 Tax=Hamadaea tsunoensis TaxID=53368 RepID=UPI0004174928|nr:ParB/RepB/Spo0J family partition protein [Hamadaea tsunoensis]